MQLNGPASGGGLTAACAPQSYHLSSFGLQLFPLMACIVPSHTTATLYYPCNLELSVCQVTDTYRQCDQRDVSIKSGQCRRTHESVDVIFQPCKRAPLPLAADSR